MYSNNVFIILLYLNWGSFKNVDLFGDLTGQKDLFAAGKSHTINRLFPQVNLLLALDGDFVLENFRGVTLLIIYVDARLHEQINILMLTVNEHSFLHFPFYRWGGVIGHYRYFFLYQYSILTVFSFVSAS